MYCPNCGKDNSNGQRYCRSCGLSLQAISQTLADELSASESDDASIEIIKPEQKRWQNPLMYGFLMLSLGIVIVIFGKTLLGEQLVADIGTILAFLGIGLLGFKGVSLMLTQSDSPSQTKALPGRETTNKLSSASQLGELPSVTEYTTRQIEPTYREQKSE